ncbi:MAG: DUF721 domain-containing protein [Chlamydiia bacterium]|nr:DUF721 domain-containing protein [Chlamydiia bacterium]MCP5509705.1 DUF721 domain-containing protein [Chlamydiales bacterium]
MTQMKDEQRVPRSYNGIKPTGRSLNELLPKVLLKIQGKQALRPDLIVKAWDGIVGEKIAAMSRAVKFDEGTLFVKVQSSTLLGILQQYEKQRLIGELRKRFPNAGVKNIIFRIG